MMENFGFKICLESLTALKELEICTLISIPYYL